MSEIPKLNYKDVGNLYGCRIWGEYALNQSKNELGWSDFRLLNYPSIEKWRKIVSSAYFLVSLFTQAWQESEHFTTDGLGGQVTKYFTKHPQWDTGEG